MRGGPSHLDMWDPKPDAPAEYRGEFGIQPSKVPGILLSDLLPMSGRIMEKWSIVRSLHHHDAGHSSGDQICFTGYPAPISPQDVLATLYQHLGIDTEQQYLNNTGRPISVLPSGKAIDELF